MRITVRSDEIVRVWPRVEVWQNSTLRYSPPKDFPEYLERQIGRARIMRCWITLDEFWDYKTGEYFPDYKIGVLRYPLEELYYQYDWKNIVPAPSGTRFEDYLTSHASHADEVMLNVRRLEREVSDGIITYEQYETVFERAVEYCKSMAPNIRYIECCNEVELGGFGRLTMDEYYKIYRCAYRALRRLNAKHNYEVPLKLGGYAKACILRRSDLWESFLEKLAEDKDPDKLLDFYSLHLYNNSLTEGMKKSREIEAAVTMSAAERFKLFLYMHNKKLKELGLPQKPIFIDEMGSTSTTKIPTDSLRNAAGVISNLIASADMENIYMFPWCTFHNPNLQISFTQFLMLEGGSYVPTPNGNAIIMLHRLAKKQLKIDENTDYRAVATAEDNRITILCTNTTGEIDEFRARIVGLKAGRVVMKEYLCDSYRNNRVTGEQVKELHATRHAEFVVSDGVVELFAVAEPYAFVLWELELY